MNRRSLDSERPIMAPSVNSTKRVSNRYSTYSNSPSFTSNCTATSAASDSTRAVGMQEIKDLTQGLDRLENKPLAQQRFIPTEKKSDHMSKLALGAKVERALERRMTNQDAVYRVKSEKRKNLGTSGLAVVNEKVSHNTIQA